MRVTIQGPNLLDESKGTFHVHAEGCGDNRHYGPYGKFGGEQDAWTIEAASRFDVCADVYADAIGDRGLTPEDAEGHQLLLDWLPGEFHFAPCCAELPVEAGA